MFEELKIICQDSMLKQIIQMNSQWLNIQIIRGKNRHLVTLCNSTGLSITLETLPKPKTMILPKSSK